MQITREFSKYQVVPLTFFQANVAASQTAVALKEGTNQNTAIVMPFAGEVVAVACNLSAAATAGTLTASATVGGTADADTATAITTETAKTSVIPRGKTSFVAGDLIGVKITSSGTWDGTTADLTVTVFVALAVEGV